jgi:hypothetical protein
MSFVYDAIQLYDLGFGPRMVSVTSPRGEISPSSTLHPKSMGKAPGRLTQAGWTGVDVNSQKFRCHDYGVAKVWRDDWGANVGFVVGDGHIVFDNDQGEIFSRVLRALLNDPLRRYVLDPKHDRDAYFVRVLDFVGDGAPVANHEMVFRNGVKSAKFSVLAHGKQAVIAGIHPGTRAPYAWERELEGLDQIPVMSVDQLGELLHKFVEEVKTLGWTLDGAPPLVSAPVSAAGTSDHKNSSGESDPSAKLLEAKALLEEIPNRDVPTGEPLNAIDRWLERYENWVSVAYALVAFLGAFARTPQALALWLDWSDRRVQQSQTSESVWKSALAQPLKFGPLGLVKLVRSLVPAATDGGAFPDLDPDDPALTTKTPIWDMLRARWAYCTVKGFIDMEARVVISRQAFGDKHAFLARALSDELTPGRPRRAKLPSVIDQFLAQPDRLEVSDVTYAPGDGSLVDANGAGPKFNTWKGTTLSAGGVSELQVKPWLDHILFVLGSLAERDRFLRWCAFVAQCPELKPNWHYLIISFQGLGKDTMVLPIKLAVGEGNWEEELIYELASPFNKVLETKLLIVGETSQPRGGFVSAHDLQTRLKPLLARPPEFLTINKKYQSPYKIPNRLALILFSNEENPLYLEREQRRVHVVNRRDAKPATLNYYLTLQAWLEHGGAELAASYILALALSDAEKNEFIGGVAPATDDKTELEHLNIHPALAALEELLAEGAEGKGPFASLVATQGDIAALISGDVKNKPSSQIVRTWLLDMERRKTGVRRLRVDPKGKQWAGVVSDGKHSGRLWLLADKAPDGREWTDMTNAEIIALWKNLPPPPNATVHQHPAAKKNGSFSDDEEPV